MRTYLVLLIFITVHLEVFAISDWDTLQVRKTFSINDDTFKLGIISQSSQEFKIFISKKTKGQWQVQNQYTTTADFFESYEIKDWDKDGFSDIVIQFTSNGEYESFLFLFNPEKGQFVNIEMYWWYCGSYHKEVYLKGTPNLYCSYIYWGCEGGSYQSILFTVCEYKIVVLGIANINYCDAPYQINIYKNGPDNKIKHLMTINASYIERNYTHPKEIEFWQNYLAHYWKKYHSAFIY